MATVVNNADREGSWGPVVIAVIVILAAIAFVVWGMPAMQGGGTNVELPSEIDVNLPAAPAAGGGAQ